VTAVSVVAQPALAEHLDLSPEDLGADPEVAAPALAVAGPPADVGDGDLAGHEAGE
jgi:hypothetical protein